MTPTAGDVLVELAEITFEARLTAEEIHKVGEPDLRFLDGIPEDKKLYAADLTELGSVILFWAQLAGSGSKTSRGKIIAH